MNLSLFLSVGFSNTQMPAQVIILTDANELKLKLGRETRRRITQPLSNAIKKKLFAEKMEDTQRNINEIILREHTRNDCLNFKIFLQT